MQLHAESTTVLTIEAEAYADQLRNVLQMSIPDVDLMAALSIEVGLDFLLLAHIRLWSLKSLHVSIAVVKIMRDSTMAHKFQCAVKNVPAELISQMVRTRAYRSMQRLVR